MNDEKYVIGSGSFRLLIGDLYDLYIAKESRCVAHHTPSERLSWRN